MVEAITEAAVDSAVAMEVEVVVATEAVADMVVVATEVTATLMELPVDFHLAAHIINVNDS